MGTEIDIIKCKKYPPECFISALPVDLIEGENKVAEYVGFGPYILSIQGLSFTRYDGLVFRMDADGVTDAVKLDNLNASKGLDYEEAIKVPSARIATLKFTAPANITSYQWRHKVSVFKPTVALKVLLGLTLKGRELELVEKYNIDQEHKLRAYEPFNPFTGIEEWRTVMVKLTSSGVVFKLPVPKDKKAILTGISAVRPSGSANAYLDVTRDDLETLHLDLYCLPSLSYEAPIRIVALDELLVELDVKVAGSYNIRLDYGIGHLTLPEKCAWTPEDLTAEERKEAEDKGIFEKLEVGLSI